MGIVKIKLGNVKGPKGDKGEAFTYEDLTPEQVTELTKEVAAKALAMVNVSVPNAPVGYVSLGDSIAAGHTINAEWDRDYGERSQYGVNGNTSTQIVRGSYTDLIRNELVSIYGENGVKATSFARSGDTVADLMAKLDHAAVRSAIEKAELVTVCIGANDVLQPAVTRLEEYITTGSLANAEAVIAANMTNLSNDNASASFYNLFKKLEGINPNAKYVFTTIYNPYKYLWVAEDRNGFFAPLLGLIPEMNLDVDEYIEDWFGIDDLGYPVINDWDILHPGWVSIELGLDVDNLIKDALLNTTYPQLIFDRVNRLPSWSESRVTELNTILRNKINAYRTVNPNFSLVDSKAVFDQFPDKDDNSGTIDYSDLVSVEYTRIYNTVKMSWGALWEGSNPAQFWSDLVFKHLYWINAVPSTNVWDYVDFHTDEFVAELMQLIVEKVILPDVDPHPEPHGHQVLKRVFTNGIGLVKYETNGGGHYCGEVMYPGDKLPYTVPSRYGYYFGGWFADGKLRHEFDHSRTDFVDTNAALALSDLVSGNSVKAKVPKTTTLYARWPSNE